MKLPAASLPRCGKVFRTSAPEERTGTAGAATLDPSPDGRDAGVKPVEDRVLQPLPRRPREEPLHGAHPQGRGRREVKRPVGTRLQPLADHGRPVRGRVVEDDVPRGSGPDPLGDMVEKGGEYLRAVARDLAGGDVEGRPQSWVRVSSEAAAAFFPAPVSALARPLFVNRRDDGGVDLWTDDVADSDLEPRVPGHLLEGLHPHRPVPGVFRRQRHMRSGTCICGMIFGVWSAGSPSRTGRRSIGASPGTWAGRTISGRYSTDRGRHRRGAQITRPNSTSTFAKP